MFQTIQRKFKEMKNNIFSQEVKGHFVPTNLSKHFYILLILSLISFIFGILITNTYYNLYENIIYYNNTTNMTIYLPSSTVYFYIQIDNFYQTNLKYSKSISYKQLEGGKDTNDKHTEPLDTKGDKDYYPAGILPNTYFQDKIRIRNLDNINDLDNNNNDLDIKTKGISWESMKNRIKPCGYSLNEIISPPLWEEYKEVPDLSNDERFINWIYTAPFYRFRKLWGILDVSEEGYYNLNIESTFPYGNKSLVFSEMSWVGTKNYFLSVSLIIIGLVGLIFSFLLYRKIFD